MTRRLLVRSHLQPMLPDSYNLARRSYSEGECPLHHRHFAGSLLKTAAGEVFCALNCLTRIRAGFGICQHDCGNDS
jgi:hypothetical protein